jgi:hypothetical protein
MNHAEFVQQLRRTFAFQLESKPSWGSKEVMQEYDQAVAHVLAAHLDQKGGKQDGDVLHEATVVPFVG